MFPLWLDVSPDITLEKISRNIISQGFRENADGSVRAVPWVAQLLLRVLRHLCLTKRGEKLRDTKRN